MVEGQHEVTLGEVYRLTKATNDRITEIASSMIGRNEYEADQARSDDRFQALGKEIADLKADQKATETELAAGKAQTIELERKQNDQRSNRILTIMGWISMPILGLIVAVLFPFGGGQG